MSLSEIEQAVENLPPRELADARQHLYLAFERAVARYDPHPAGKCSAAFTTFLHVVIAHAYSNYCAGWRAYHRRTSAWPLDEEGRFNDHSGALVPDFTSVVVGEDTQEVDVPDCLTRVFDYLPPHERHLLWTWLQTGNDREVAVRLGITVEAARQRRQRLVRRLRKLISRS